MGGQERVRSIVIAGGGVTGWMAATALVRFAPMTRVTVIDCPVDDVAVQATLPAFKDFHALIGVDEHEMLARSGGTMRLGTRFADPARPGGYLHAFGDFGLEVGGVAFYQLWLRARAAGQPVDLDDYNLAAIAAKMGRFARPAADKRAMMDYGYHLDTALYAAFLKPLALAQGVGCKAGEISSVTRDGESGLIAAILLRDGRSIEGDFFVDCTGASAVLMEALDLAFEDWSSWVPSSREAAVDAGALPDLPPLSSAAAHVSGWQRRVPLQHRTWHSLSFAPGETGEEAVLDALGDRGESEPRFTTHRRGRRQRFWAGNCVALGAAAASIEPIEAGELDIAGGGIAALLSLFPDRGDAVAEAGEFDRIMSASIEAQRDLTLLHHVVIEQGKPVLRVGREAFTLPDSLEHRIELFRGRGRLRPRDAGDFGPADWLAVLIGRAVRPSSWDPLADAIESPRAQQNFLRLAGLFRQSAETMPDHAAYIARHCAYRP
jgi:tryptophan halogenase